MRINTPIISRMFLLSLILYTQVRSGVISGVVRDHAEGRPLENVNVFIAHSTTGAATDRDGYFRLNRIRPGKHELVVQASGYQTFSQVLFISIDDTVILDIHLEEEIYQADPTVVYGEIPEQWLADLKIFKRFFIGRKDPAGQCIIQNEEVLDFNRSGEGILSASAGRLLIIMNYALGYRIRCVLEEFIWDERTNRCRWIIKPVYNELMPRDNSQEERWRNNRMQSYRGSLRHFFKSILNDALKRNGFRVTPVAIPGLVPENNPSADALNMTGVRVRPGKYHDVFYLHLAHPLYIEFSRDEASWLVSRVDEIELDPFGNITDVHSVDVYGSWAEAGIASFLPNDYIPPADKMHQ